MYVHRMNIVLSIVGLLLAGADWPQFRGPDSNAVAPDALPTQWDEHHNVAWRTALPGRGPSSPIVVRGRLIVTSSDGRNQTRLHVLCFDARTGRQRWHRQFWATGRTMTHPTTAVAAPTPASDGQRVFAFYSSNDLVCLDLDGNLIWYRGLASDYPKAGNDVGMASSPVVADGAVVVQIENQADSFACALEAETGLTRWRVRRDPRAGWTSPIVAQRPDDGSPMVVLQSPGTVTGHDLDTGRTLWRLDDEYATISSPLAVGDRLFLPSNGIKAVTMAGGSDWPTVLWQARSLRCGGPSPVCHDGRIYALAGSILSCGDARSGRVLWKLRLAGRYWATPVVAGRLIYCVNQDGQMQVVRPGNSKGEVIAVNRFEEPIQATPAVADGAMYVRSDRHLWKIAGK